jgi:hypothetical protein
MMKSGSVVRMSVLIALACIGVVQGAETFKATATVKTAGGTTATTPVIVTIDRTTPQPEADKLVAAFKASGADGLRAALKGVPPTGSVQVADGPATPTRITLERATDKGRLLTIVTDKPIVFLGAGKPGAKPIVGYDFAVLDLEIAANGGGSGTLAPAAKISLKGEAFVVQDYNSELVRLTVNPAR